MDSGAVVGSKLYAAHSNYDESPMESSIEVFDTKTMRHIGTHSFGIYRGSLTWLDRHDGAWWAGFANYDVVPDGESEPYGETDNTQVVKMDDDFQVVESWTIPKEILDRFKPMSNSGGSWGPDGRLWLTGHDLGEAYVMKPRRGSELDGWPPSTPRGRGPGHRLGPARRQAHAVGDQALDQAGAPVQGALEGDQERPLPTRGTSTGRASSSRLPCRRRSS